MHYLSVVSFLSTSRLTGREPLVFLPGPFPNEPPTGKAHLKQCEQMTLTRRQKRLCRREPGLAETLRESVRLSLLECRYQFRNERWNCSLDGRGSLLKRGKLTRPSKAEAIKLRSLYSSLVRQVHSYLICFFSPLLACSVFYVKASVLVKCLWARHQTEVLTLHADGNIN